MSGLLAAILAGVFVFLWRRGTHVSSEEGPLEAALQGQSAYPPGGDDSWPDANDQINTETLALELATTVPETLSGFAAEPAVTGDDVYL
jgi:hypothetical protein